MTSRLVTERRKGTLSEGSSVTPHGGEDVQVFAWKLTPRTCYKETCMKVCTVVLCAVKETISRKWMKNGSILHIACSAFLYSSLEFPGTLTIPFHTCGN